MAVHCLRVLLRPLAIYGLHPRPPAALCCGPRRATRWTRLLNRELQLALLFIGQRAGCLQESPRPEPAGRPPSFDVVGRQGPGTQLARLSCALVCNSAAAASRALLRLPPPTIWLRSAGQPSSVSGLRSALAVAGQSLPAALRRASVSLATCVRPSLGQLLRWNRLAMSLA